MAQSEALLVMPFNLFLSWSYQLLMKMIWTLRNAANKALYRNYTTLRFEKFRELGC